MASSNIRPKPETENAVPGRTALQTKNNSSSVRTYNPTKQIHQRALSFRAEARDLIGASEHAALALAAHFGGAR